MKQGYFAIFSFFILVFGIISNSFFVQAVQEAPETSDGEDSGSLLSSSPPPKDDGQVLESVSDVSALAYNQRAIIPKGSLAFDGTFGVSTLTGSATYSYPIEVPKGTKDLQPSVGLFYNHQRTK